MIREPAELRRLRVSDDHFRRMTRFRMFVLFLSILQLAIAGFTALVGLFADGGGVWSRLLLVVVHPLGAVGLLLAVVLPRPGNRLLLAVVGLLIVNIAGDVSASALIASSAIKGDWWLPLVFSVVPVIGMTYVMVRMNKKTA